MAPVRAARPRPHWRPLRTDGPPKLHGVPRVSAGEQGDLGVRDSIASWWRLPVQPVYGLDQRYHKRNVNYICDPNFSSSHIEKKKVKLISKAYFRQADISNRYHVQHVTSMKNWGEMFHFCSSVFEI